MISIVGPGHGRFLHYFKSLGQHTKESVGKPRELSYIVYGHILNAAMELDLRTDAGKS